MLNARPVITVSAMLGLAIMLQPLPAGAGDAEITLKQLVRKCTASKRSTELTPKCLRALLRNPETMAALEEIPAFRDGRLSVADLMADARRREVTSRQRLTRGDPNEEIADDAVEADGRTPRFLSDAEVRQLVAGEGFDVRATFPDRRRGPTDLQNYPPPLPPGGFPIPKPGFTPAPPNPNEVDVGAFLDDLHALLSPNVNGYALKLRQQGQTVGILQWNWARNPNQPDLPAMGWNTDRRMHIASVSKFMTAIGFVHLLESRPGIDAFDSMSSWLPAYWNRNAGSNEFITFDNLMDHRSGFSTGGSASDWQTMKTNVEAGVSLASIGSADYENMNFGLLRILIATIGGYVNPSLDFGFESLNDAVWDALTQAAYDDYMQTYVFNPSGAFPTLDTNQETVLAYRFNGTGNGWDTGDMSGSAGGFGWHMTISEILDVTRSFRKGQIVSLGGVTAILNNSWGLNSSIGGNSTLAGNTWFKAGRWTDNINNPALARSEQCFVYMMPKEMELVVFVNSEISNQGSSLTNLVRTAFVNNIVTP